MCVIYSEQSLHIVVFFNRYIITSIAKKIQSTNDDSLYLDVHLFCIIRYNHSRCHTFAKCVRVCNKQETIFSTYFRVLRSSSSLYTKVQEGIGTEKLSIDEMYWCFWLVIEEALSCYGTITQHVIIRCPYMAKACAYWNTIAKSVGFFDVHSPYMPVVVICIIPFSLFTTRIWTASEARSGDSQLT